ncbi:MAG TPA: type II toxin-antitoxin system HicB family antitoxin [Acidobacteriaceae bacterium]
MGAWSTLVTSEFREATVAMADNAVAQSPGEATAELGLTVVFRAVPEENIVVAECLEIPGCVSQGATQEEAHKNIQDAMRLCLSVIFEDRIREVIESHAGSIDYTGITGQQSIRVRAVPQLEYA